MPVLEEKAGAGVDAGDNIILRPYIQSRVNNRNRKCFKFNCLFAISHHHLTPLFAELLCPSVNLSEE